MWNTKLEHLQPYPFERLRELHKDCQHDGELAHIPLSLGEPKHPPPDFVVRALADAQALTTQLGIYPATKGSDDLRLAISQWLGGRFGIGIDPATQVLPVYGTREALFSVAQALLSGKPGSLVGIPNPFYHGLNPGHFVCRSRDARFRANPKRLIQAQSFSAPIRRKLR